MKKFILGLIIGGLLLSGGWFAWGAIQTEVGMYGFATNNIWSKLPLRDLGTAYSTSATTDWALPVIASCAAYLTSSGTTLDYCSAHQLNNSTNLTGSHIGLVTASTSWVYDTGTSDWHQWRMDIPSSDAENTGNGVPQVASLNLLNNGDTTWSRARSVDATTLSSTTSTGVTLVAPLSTWSVTHTPAAATQATASKAAGGASVRHVATTITACFSGTAVSVPVQVNLRDGASGAGTVLRTWLIGVSIINGSTCVDLSGLGMIGTANTAITLEFSAAGAADTNQTVTLTGYTVS